LWHRHEGKPSRLGQVEKIYRQRVSAHLYDLANDEPPETVPAGRRRGTGMSDWETIVLKGKFIDANSKQGEALYSWLGKEVFEELALSALSQPLHRNFKDDAVVQFVRLLRHTRGRILLDLFSACSRKRHGHRRNEQRWHHVGFLGLGHSTLCNW